MTVKPLPSRADSEKRLHRVGKYLQLMIFLFKPYRDEVNSNINTDRLEVLMAFGHENFPVMVLELIDQ